VCFLERFTTARETLLERFIASGERRPDGSQSYTHRGRGDTLSPPVDRGSV